MKDKNSANEQGRGRRTSVQHTSRNSQQTKQSCTSRRDVKEPIMQKITLAQNPRNKMVNCGPGWSRTSDQEIMSPLL